MSTIKIVDEQGQEARQEEPKEYTPPTGLDAPFETDRLAVADVMGLEKKEMGTYADKIDTLLKFARLQEPKASPEKIKWIIRDLDMRLGTGPLAQKRINYVARIAYLRLEKNKIEEELQASHL